VQQFVAELERLIATNLTHPGIDAPIAAGVDASHTPYLVQEFVAADSLDTLVRDYGPAPPVDALRLAVQVAGALDFASVVNVDHGALHPRDVLVSSDDARMTGLGVTRALERVGVTAPVRRPYTAPERVNGGNWDRRADIFSLAALLFEMLSGRRVAASGRRAAESLSAIPGADLAALRDAFARGLADSPAGRFDSALEFAGALKAAFPGVDIQSPDDSNRASVAPGLSTLDIPVSTSAPDSRQPALDFQLREPEIRTADTGRYRDIDVPPTAVPAQVEPTVTSPPPGLLSSYGEPSVLERSRSAIWPLALALIVGIALGFGAGYGVGRRDGVVTTAAPSPTPSVPPPQPTPPGREFTDTAVAESPKPTPTPAPEVRSQPNATPGIGGPPKTGVAAVTEEAGRLIVRSTPAGARVFLDGRDQGRTPATVRDVRRGAHRLRVVHEGYATEERRILMTPAHPVQSVTVTLARTRAAEPPARRAAESAARPAAPNPPSGATFFGSLSVESRPPGAKVFIDGKLTGTTPLVLPQIGAGEHAVRLEHDGYQRWSSSVRIMSGERNRVTASLEK
jgi:serine/threonine-protein kinase